MLFVSSCGFYSEQCRVNLMQKRGFEELYLTVTAVGVKYPFVLLFRSTMCMYLKLFVLLRVTEVLTLILYYHFRELLDGSDFTYLHICYISNTTQTK